VDGVSREIRLVARPKGFPGEDLFELAETPIPEPGEGQLLVRNAYFSVDPYMRPRMNDVRSYVAPFTLGEPMVGGAVGRVELSRNDRYAEGDWVVHGLAGGSGRSRTGRACGGSTPLSRPSPASWACSGCRA